MNKYLLIAIIAVIILAGVGLYFVNTNKVANNKEVTVGGARMTADKDILDNAVQSSDHTIFVSAIQAADLVESLKEPGPFTVFAPTNAAFDKLPEGTVETLLHTENRQQLVDLLTYHVVPGLYKVADLKDGLTLNTANGEVLAFTEKDGKLYINDSATIEIGDVPSSNGVTHVIDTVLLPLY